MASDGVWTVMEALRWTARDLEGRGIASARLDAELLLADAIGTSRVGLYVAHDRALSPEERARFRRRIERRRRGEPVAYILGTREFYGLELVVDARVLVPRPETELVVDAVLEALPEHSVGERVLDLGTGSGAIATAVARARPTATVDAVDASTDALDVARENARRHGAWGVRLHAGDLYSALGHRDPYDVVVSNPPYIPTREISELPIDVVGFEPRVALDGGADGLSVLRRIVKEAPAWLVPGGVLVLEVSAGQAERVAALVEAVGAFLPSRVRRDYSAIERVIVAKRLAGDARGR